MRVIVDAMSGDNAPKEIIKGALNAANEFKCEITLVGKSETIKAVAEAEGIKGFPENLKIEEASDVITMTDDVFSVKSKKDSSMTRSLIMLSQHEGDALVSAGNTGALYTGAVLYCARIKGLRKAALAAILPFDPPMLVVDAGANVSVTDEVLEQFAVMGSIYVKKVLNVESPRVGLLNNGTERTKGNDILRSAYERLEENESINFVGNIEGQLIPDGACDVLVTDGFCGNIVLKLTEGIGSFMMKKLYSIYQKNPITMLSAAMIRSHLQGIKHDFNPAEYGGAPLLGIRMPVIKAHGSSDAYAIKNAVRAAISYAESDVISEIASLV